MKALCGRCSSEFETRFLLAFLGGRLCDECQRRDAVAAEEPPEEVCDPFPEEEEPADIDVCGQCKGTGEVLELVMGQPRRDWATGSVYTGECKACFGTGSGWYAWRGFVSRVKVAA